MSAILGEVLLELGSKYLVPFLLDQVNSYVAERAAGDQHWTSFKEDFPEPIRLPALGNHYLPNCAPISRNVLSSTPGRLRLHVDGLRGSSERTRELEISLCYLPGVRSVRANALTGNALITYDPGQVTPALIEAASSRSSATPGEGALPAAS